MEGGDQLRRAVRGQARGVPRRVAYWQGLGIWGGQLLPVRWEKVEIALRDAFRIRRIYRKRAKRKGGPLRRITVFVRYENALRLLGFLGYRLE